MNILALLAGLFSGIIGAMGLGGGAVLIIYLSLFTKTKQLTAQGINLLFFIPIALVAVIIYSFKGLIKWKLTIKITLWGFLGTALGLLCSNFLGSNLTRKAFGILLILLALYEIFGKNIKKVEKNNQKCYTKNE